MMKINKKCNSSVNPKTGKKYSTEFKKRMVQYYLLGMYDEATICKKYQINRTLLMQWRKWYYDHFESSNYSSPNYGKKLPQQVSQMEQIIELKAQLVAAQKALQKEKIKSRGLEILLDIAKVDHQLPVKKNGRKESSN